MYSEKKVVFFVTLTASFFLINTAQAYVGPTIGVGMFGILFGLICVIGITLYALIIKPIRKLILKQPKRDKNHSGLHSKKTTTLDK